MRSDKETEMDVVAIVLGIVALLVGIYHVSEIKLVLKSTKDQLKNLNEIQGSISTRYLAEFPYFISDIVKLIKEARKEIIIFCDIPAYGQFSARSDWIQYSHAIEDLEGKANIKLTCLNPERRISFYYEQFLQELPWDTWKEVDNNKERLKQLLLAKSSTVDVKDLTDDVFVKLLEDTNTLMLQGAFARAELREIEFFMPTYFWLVDGTDAIFSIPALSGGHTEYGFITTDQKLIDALREMRERYIRRQPVSGNVAALTPSSPVKIKDP
jgi:hypothetical protein